MRLFKTTQWTRSSILKATKELVFRWFERLNQCLNEEVQHQVNVQTHSDQEVTCFGWHSGPQGLARECCYILQPSQIWIRPSGEYMNVNERYSFELAHLFARGASFCPDKTQAGSLQHAHTHTQIFTITHCCQAIEIGLALKFTLIRAQYCPMMVNRSLVLLSLNVWPLHALLSHEHAPNWASATPEMPLWVWPIV